jgi:endonuclease III
LKRGWPTVSDSGTARHRESEGSPALTAGAIQTLPEISARLKVRYGTAPLGNKPDPLDELIYIQLSIRTREDTYTDIYEELHRAVGGEWVQLLHTPDADLLAILRRGGMAAVKLSRLRAQLERIVRTFGEATLDPILSWSDEESEEYLRSLPGVGPKTARCVLLYSMQRPVFPVDGHCRRVLGRLGFLPPETDRKKADDLLQELVPAALRHDLHVNLVHHGRVLCVPGTPRCPECPLLHLCPTGSTTA